MKHLLASGLIAFLIFAGGAGAGAQQSVTMLTLADQAARQKLTTTDESDPAKLRQLAGNLSDTTTDVRELAARVKLALQEPAIWARFPNAALRTQIAGLEQDYVGGNGERAMVFGEDAVFQLINNEKCSPGNDFKSLPCRSELMAKDEWVTKFPSFHAGPPFERARANGGEFLAEFLRNPAFSSDDLAGLSRSEIPEVRAAVVLNSADQTQIAGVATTDPAEGVCMAAVSKLTDEKALVKVAIQGGLTSGYKFAAVEKLTDQRALESVFLQSEDPLWSRALDRITDQRVLAEIATGPADEVRREQAVAKLTDQVLLAKIALEDRNQNVSEYAIRQLSDQELLAKVALGATVNIRWAAIRKLTDRKVLAKIATTDTHFYVRKCARDRLAELQNDSQK
jgi:hypothetical protein